jgi:hypothetical protein
MSYDLKPCPFCGGKATAWNLTIEGAVHCESCRATIVRQHHAIHDTGYEDAIAAWNTRAPDPSIEALTEERDMATEGWAEATRLIDVARQQYGAEKSRAEKAEAALAVTDNTVAELEKERDKVWDEAVWVVAQVVDQEMARIGFISGPDGFGRRAEMRNVIVEELKSVQSMRATLAEIEGEKG